MRTLSTFVVNSTANVVEGDASMNHSRRVVGLAAVMIKAMGLLSSTLLTTSLVAAQGMNVVSISDVHLRTVMSTVEQPAGNTVAQLYVWRSGADACELRTYPFAGDVSAVDAMASGRHCPLQVSPRSGGVMALYPVTPVSERSKASRQATSLWQFAPLSTLPSLDRAASLKLPFSFVAEAALINKQPWAAGADEQGRPLIMRAARRQTAEVWRGDQQGVVTQLLPLRAGRVLAVVNFGDGSSQLLWLSNAGRVQKVQTLRGGPSSLGVSSNGHALVVWHEGRSLMASVLGLDGNLERAVTLVENRVGAGTDLFRVVPAGEQWYVVGGEADAIRAYRLDDKANLLAEVAATSGLKVPGDWELFAAMVEGELHIHGLSSTQDSLKRLSRVVFHVSTRHSLR